MSTYKDTDALLELIDYYIFDNKDAYKNHLDIFIDGMKDGYYRIRSNIINLPSADVVEVVHGEWIKTTIAEPCGTDELHMTIYRDRETVKCSECGNPSPIYNIEFEFCPRCGARMDGDK